MTSRLDSRHKIQRFLVGFLSAGASFGAGVAALPLSMKAPSTSP